MKKRINTNAKLYYFIDVDLHSRQIIGWGIEEKGEVDVRLTNGCHRVFLSKGQYNKFVENVSEF
ncbi:MAG: hypothetical protein GY903_00340 [Fuerstiella sp.]|nr:hypothetical protein [Fuerstiella sp.]MCP4852927.1 hypothetical protein [Fuerstiella sp.]